MNTTSSTATTQVPDRRVSVVVPVYRVLPHIEACMRSLAAQTHRPWEVLLVDDCGGDASTDLAVAVLQEAGLAHQVLRHPVNRGLGAARNTGAAHAAGDLVWFLDSDDSAEPTFLERLVGLQAETGADVVVCRTQRVDLAGEPTGVDEAPYGTTGCTGLELAHLLLLGTVKGYAWNKLFRRSVLPPAPFPEGVAYEDLPAVLRVALGADRVALTDEPLYRYTRNPVSISTRFSSQTLDLLVVADSVAAQLREAGLERPWRAARLQHLYRDGVLPLANMALAARWSGTAPAGDPLVAEAYRRARSRVRLGDLLVLALRGGRRLAVPAAVLRVSPRLYARAVERTWPAPGTTA